MIGALAVPALLLFYFGSQIIMLFPVFGSGSKFTATFDRLVPQSSGIVAGDRADPKAQIARLRSMTARPEMAAGAATRVNFIAVAFDQKPEPTKSSQVATRHVIDPDGYRRMTLDLAQLPREALIVIADEPIRWTVAGANSAWGLIGFEGLAPFDIVNGRANLLAGYRIAAFGARETARADDPFQADLRRRRVLCASVRAWTDHFGTGSSQVTFALVNNPTMIGSNGGAITSDGQTGTSWTGPAIQSICKR